jgi:hypothetical protein
MKTFEEINVEETLNFDDFYVLFHQLPLNKKEKKSLSEYYQMYTIFIGAEVKPIDAWVAVRNIFAIKNQQIAKRIKKGAISELKL